MAERVYCLYRVSTNKQVDHDENNQADIPRVMMNQPEVPTLRSTNSEKKQ